MPTLRIAKQPGQNGPTIELAEEERLPVWGEDADLAVVGTSPTRLEGREKVTGRAQYAADIRLPGLLVAGILRSPLPHARLTAIDTTAAAALPGVHAIVCATTAPDIDWFEEGKLFDPTLRYVGDEIAAVAAESPEIVADALRLITLDLEPLPFVTEIEAALAPGAPAIHAGGNIAGEVKRYARGDVEAGLAAADAVVDATFTTRAALHNALEAHGCTAFWDGDELTLWDSTQAVFVVRQQVAAKLGLPEHRVRVIKEHMGGGFGAKQISWKPDVIAALLSRQAGRSNCCSTGKPRTWPRATATRRGSGSASAPPATEP